MERRRRIGSGDHLSDELIIDVRLADGDWSPTAEDLLVVVEPVYGGVAVAAALDAGWKTVEIAELGANANAPGREPIPLVSFEQGVPRDQPGATRCRVRSDDLVATLERVMAGDATPILATPANARPAMSGVARAVSACARVTFVPAIHVVESEEEVDHPDEAMTVDGMWAAGMLIRILLEELETERPVWLADGAGVAVSVAQGAEDPASQLTAGVRWRGHLDTGGNADDLRIAAAIDTIGTVPIVIEDEEGTFIARPWIAPIDD